MPIETAYTRLRENLATALRRAGHNKTKPTTLAELHAELFDGQAK